MRNIFRGILTVNEKDTLATALTKGMVRGWASSTLAIGMIAGATLIIDKAFNKKSKGE